MNRISAAENMIIETGPDSWRLIASGEAGEERGLLEATVDRQVRYTEAFARSRRLPAEGRLPAPYVVQVVLGWSANEETWRLGLLLAPDIADPRGSRWCELARWPDPEATVFEDLARESGMGLAQILNRPFNFIPPQRRPETAPEPEPPLPGLPLTIGGWSLESGANDTLAFIRSGKWSRRRMTRAVWYTFWMIVYVVLSVTTLNSDLALPNAGAMLPNPDLLPYLGLATAVGLILMILYTLYELLTAPDRIEVDPRTAQITALRSGRQRWRVNAGEIESVYVTQVVNKRVSEAKSTTVKSTSTAATASFIRLSGKVKRTTRPQTSSRPMKRP